MCKWVTMLYSRNLTEHCKPAITEKNKNHYTLKKKKKNGKMTSVLPFLCCVTNPFCKGQNLSVLYPSIIIDARIKHLFIICSHQL